MIDWSRISNYLSECDTFAASAMEDPAEIPRIDENVTSGLAGLRDLYGLDLEDEATVFALIVGWCVAYRYGCSVGMGIQNPLEAQVYLRRHGPISGYIGLVARTLTKNLGVTIPDTGASE